MCSNICSIHNLNIMGVVKNNSVKTKLCQTDELPKY